ncbi:hypothetical protein Ancab_039613 [Ancistrocladus abbreviatus]
MAGAVVSSAANWIGTQLVNEVIFLLEVEDQVRSLQQELEYIALHLREADSAEGEDDEQLRLFTKEIREIAFNAEDVVDNYVLKVASSSSANIGGNFLKKFLRFLCSSCDVHSIGKETEAILKRTREAVERLKRFQNARVIAPGEGFNQPRPHRIVMQTYPHADDTYVVGLDEDAQNLVRRLTSNMEAGVVAIVGPGGAGKTTLARKIYNDIRVKNHFKTVAWVTISQQWNRKDLLFEILRQTKGIRTYEERNTIKDWSEREFVEAIYGFLSENAYLLVLDDMWGRETWDCIYPALPHPGSTRKVMITTRNEDLPLQVGQKCIVHRPQLLTEDQSWELFRKIALEETKTQATTDDNIIKLGKEMTRECGGLPLGVVTLAGLLRMKDTSEWEEGFVTPHDESVQVNESLEDVAEQYLSELIQRCVVQVVEKSFTTGKAKRCRLHDLMRDFCIVKAEEQCFLRVLMSSTSQSNVSTPLRRVSIRGSGSNEVSLPTQHLHIRSLIQFGEKTLNLQTICQDLKLLRVLILYGVETHDGYLPEKLGNLRHLRYLALRNSNIKGLPESIGNLSNLLYFEYTTLSGIEHETIPDVFWKLKLLRHLYLDPHIDIPIRLKLHALTNLQTLWPINARNWESEAELEGLSPSLQKLIIYRIVRQRQLDAVFGSPCMTSGNLVHLWLDWESGVKLENLGPIYEYCQRLLKLELCGKIGEDCLLQFPPSLVKLKLMESNHKLHDPMVAAGRLGQLKYLFLGDAYTGAKMTCNVGSFPKLEELHMIVLKNLEEWRVEKGAMPRLKKLKIDRCPKLKRLPQELKFCSLQELEIQYMPRTFCHRLFKQGEEYKYEY